MVEFNVKIELNVKILYLDEKSGAKHLDEELFNKFINSAKSFIFCDDGDISSDYGEEYSGLKVELKKFDISADKDFGPWEFEVNNKSRSIIIKTFKAYKKIGAEVVWTLKGDNFSINYIDCGDDYALMDGPSGTKTVYAYFIIHAKGSNLNIINSILRSYKTKI